MNSKAVALCLGLWIFSGAARADETVGERPYEMVWADRTEDTHPAILDFENLEGWAVECRDSEARFVRSREQQLWGKYVGTLTYRATGSSPLVTLKPPEPIVIPLPVKFDTSYTNPKRKRGKNLPTSLALRVGVVSGRERYISDAFDCVNFWIYGNNWAWVPDPSTPQVEVRLVLESDQKEPVRISMGTVRWKEWWVMHRRLTPDQMASVGRGTRLLGIEIAGGRNREDRVIHFDNLSVYNEPLGPLKFEPRPKRGIGLPAGQTVGTNTGPGRLPFPTREETILPDNLTSDFQVTLEESDDVYTFRYQGSDGRLVWRYGPSTGTLGDLSVAWDDRTAFQPMADGGVYFLAAGESTARLPERIEPIACRRVGDTVESTWRCTLGEESCEVTYTLRLWQKSLVIDVKCTGGNVGEVRFGKAVGADNPRLVTLPYLPCDQQRPAVLVMGPVEEPLFLFGLVDHCRSNGSMLWAENQVNDDGVAYNGGSRYLPKTDGRRNDCFERIFLTVSSRFEEILPNVPNPKSPWMHVAGERLWRAHGASDREHDYAIWKEVARYGMTKVVITDHETGWRDGGESFTLRTRAAPRKGGDRGQADYARKIRALGFRYGIYNNYTDFAPVNEHWDEDYVSRLSDGEWRTAWPRCYNPKPSRAVELEARLAPVIQEKFHLSTAYCDVHTAVRPWQYCDFDARVPGAGTFAATFYAYGEIMLHQKKTWNGPVYSEGNNHWYYCGLTDGNYAQDQSAGLDVNPWLVDFDLRKLHPLCCNFGMGNFTMFYGRKIGLGRSPEEREERLDRFLAATLAFGHTGFLALEGGMSNTVRSYFNVQQVHAAYAQRTVDTIQYADENGRLLETSAAVATGAYRRSQIVVRYDNGLTVTVNGHPKETWKTPRAELPPGGWYVQSDDDHLLALSALTGGRGGHRADYVDSPAYLYIDGRGRFTRFECAAADGQMIAHRRGSGQLEVIPVGACLEFGVSLDGRSATAVAMDKEGDAIGPAQTRWSRGLVYVAPLDGAFSYLLTPAPAPEVALSCHRDVVVPGETVMIVGISDHAFHVPADAAPGERLWQNLDGAWIDFTVVPLVDATLQLEGAMHLELLPHVPNVTQATVTLDGQTQRVRFTPAEPLRLEFPWQTPTGEEVRTVQLDIAAGPLKFESTWWLKTEEAVVPVAELPSQFRWVECFRGGPERPPAGDTGALVHRTERSCGEVAKTCLFMHPPYKKGTGYSAAVFDSIDLPAEPAAAFRSKIGKADGSDPGDGILFRVAVIDSDGTETAIAEKQWIEHAWTSLEADLSPYAGERIRIKLIADVGPEDNSSGDWACWADLVVQSTQPTLVSTVDEQPVRLRREPGPFPLTGLSLDEIRSATRGTLHFQGIGLQCGGEYVSHGLLNDVALGKLPAAGGNEREGSWSDATVPLSPPAIASLGEWNRFTIRNPGRDFFKISRVWIELQLADGRTASSRITNSIYSQPPGWTYSEGEFVPFEEDIAVEIRWDASGAVSAKKQSAEIRGKPLN